MITTEKPWGLYNILYEDSKCKIKKIIIKPGCSISLQSHSKRDELWKIIEGEGEVIIEGVTYFASSSSIKDSYFIIRKNIQHRITNTEQEALVFIEIQTGDSFSEDDIIRYKDEYDRI